MRVNIGTRCRLSSGSRLGFDQSKRTPVWIYSDGRPRRFRVIARPGWQAQGMESERFGTIGRGLDCAVRANSTIASVQASGATETGCP